MATTTTSNGQVRSNKVSISGQSSIGVEDSGCSYIYSSGYLNALKRWSKTGSPRVSDDGVTVRQSLVGAYSIQGSGHLLTKGVCTLSSTFFSVRPNSIVVGYSLVLPVDFARDLYDLCSPFISVYVKKVQVISTADGRTVELKVTCKSADMAKHLYSYLQALRRLSDTASTAPLATTDSQYAATGQLFKASSTTSNYGCTSSHVKTLGYLIPYSSAAHNTVLTATQIDADIAGAKAKEEEARLRGNQAAKENAKVVNDTGFYLVVRYVAVGILVAALVFIVLRIVKKHKKGKK